MDIREAIKYVISGNDLEKKQMISVMRSIMLGQTTDAQNAAFLVGLQMKGVKSDELLGGATVMRELSTKVNVEPGPYLVDTCGTGGSGSNKFNVSTAAAIVAASAGARVAKHGNRGATSTSGSADVLEAAGVRLTLEADKVAMAIEQIGVGFMFAPAHHSAMKHVIAARKEIGVRTIFNLLGPLTNPAGSPNQIIGVFDPVWIPIFLEVLRELGSNHVMIVSADDGLDEISIASETQVGELKGGKVTTYTISPNDFGIEQYPDCSSLHINSAEESLVMLKQAFANENQPAAEIVALNAGAAIYVANLCEDLLAGVTKAREVLESGIAQEKFDQLVQFTQMADG
ncbi:MAG: anthranilate phosphoribosyltransferase [Gammaproteobacteria bacterium]|nr:anthranilate phosphoribosyltransferase [Gammaproteobacteria bacterium]